MPRSEDELAEALAQSEAWMDAVDPDEVPADAVDDRKDLRRIGVALIAIVWQVFAPLDAAKACRIEPHSQFYVEI